MGIFSTITNWARSAWNSITGAAQDIGTALTHIWHYIESVYNFFSWVLGTPLRALHDALMFWADAVHTFHNDVMNALGRVDGWIYWHFMKPLTDRLNAWMKWMIAYADHIYTVLNAKIDFNYYELINSIRFYYNIERADRIRDVNNARKYAYQLTQAALALVQHEAASGYGEDLPDRLGRIGQIADDLVTRNPAVKDLVSVFVKGVLDLIAVDDPIARFTLGIVLSQIIDKLGVDKVTGDILSSLLGPLTDHGIPSNLHDVCRDIAQRLGRLEGNWQDFMSHGGPEVYQAGDEWKSITSLSADLAILGFFVTAVADPSGWATAVSDTAGTVIDDMLGAVTELIFGR